MEGDATHPGGQPDMPNPESGETAEAPTAGNDENVILGAGDCNKDDEICEKKLKETLGPAINCVEDEGECEEVGEDRWDVDTHFYISSRGDIINEGVLSDPESIPSVTTVLDDLDLDVDLPEDDDFMEWGELDASDEEEQEELQQKYFDLFKVPEPEDVSLGENDVNPEDGDYWKDYFRHHYTNEHVNVHYPEKFLKLNLHHDRVTTIAFVPKHFPSLKYLDVSRNFVQSIQSLGKLKNLLHLNASNNGIRRFLDMCTHTPHPLREIDLSKNQITEVIRFNRFFGLVNINLAYNRLRVVNNFQHCYFLRFLNLSHNNISDIYDLDCPNLLVLLLQDNKLETVSALVKCGELRYLNVSRNQISDLSVVQSMPRLVELRAAHNRIGLMEMDVLKCLIYMSHLRITPNPGTEITLAREMLIFTLPQIRYLDKKIILPEETVEANNIFNPTFEKIAFEDQRNTRLEKATQSADAMFREFCEMYPIPPMLFLVGSSKSRAEAMGMHLKEKFHHRILLGGVHSTGTTIESGNQHDDIPISLEHFIEMKKRGHLFSTSTILGRLCGFSATQFIKAVEHGALLIGIEIPLETAICLRKWGFKATTILLMPSDAPHFNVDDFLEKERERISQHVPDHEKPKVRENRRISFSAQPTTELNSRRRQSILKQHQASDGNPDYPQMLSGIFQVSTATDIETATPEPIPEPTLEVLHKSNLTFAHFVPTDESKSEVGEWTGEDDSNQQAEKGTLEAIAQETLSLFGVKIMNPTTIDGIDWKRTILSSDFYESILSMNEAFHFLVTRHSEDPSIQLSREILEETIFALGYNLLHGPTPIYIAGCDESKLSEPAGINYQLIVVKRNPSSSTLIVNSCMDVAKQVFPRHVSFPFLTGEDGGEDDLLPQYERPTSPWYQRDGEGEFDAEEAYEGAISETVDGEEEVDVETGDGHLNKFKHRDALESAILQTRDKYLKYHLENPGFFLSVLDTRDLDESKGRLEGIVEQMLKEFEEDETNSRLYPLVESYEQISSDKHSEASEAFIKERVEMIKRLDNEWLRGYQHSVQHFSGVSELGDAATIFKRTSCPRNLLCTNLPKGYTEGQIYQLRRAETFRKRNQGMQECPSTMIPIECKVKPPELVPMPPQMDILPEEPGEIELPGEEVRDMSCFRWKTCYCGEDCICQPPKPEGYCRRRSLANFKTESLLSEFGYYGDA